MELISFQGKTNLFEKRVNEYALSGVGTDPEMNHASDADTSFTHVPIYLRISVIYTPVDSK